ncbi:MAG: hypothetical protein HY554_05535 [Elusimicrobia bacterium]|nr:hypothetical protein [Elusimicrobiota bacterium]
MAADGLEPGEEGVGFVPGPAPPPSPFYRPPPGERLPPPPPPAAEAAAQAPVLPAPEPPSAPPVTPAAAWAALADWRRSLPVYVLGVAFLLASLVLALKLRHLGALVRDARKGASANPFAIPR